MGCGNVISQACQPNHFVKKVQKIKVVGKLTIHILQISFIQSNSHLAHNSQNYMKASIQNQSYQTQINNIFDGKNKVQPLEKIFQFVINTRRQNDRVLNLQFWNRQSLRGDKQIALTLIDIQRHLNISQRQDNNKNEQFVSYLQHENKNAGKIKLSINFKPFQYELLTIKICSATLRVNVFQNRLVYVKIALGQQVYQTASVLQNKKTIPQWKNQIYTFTVPKFISEVNVQVYQKQKSSDKDIFLGTSKINIEPYVQNNSINNVYQQIFIQDQITGLIQLNVIQGQFNQQKFIQLNQCHNYKRHIQKLTKKITSNHINIQNHKNIQNPVIKSNYLTKQSLFEDRQLIKGHQSFKKNQSQQKATNTNLNKKVIKNGMSPQKDSTQKQLKKQLKSIQSLKNSNKSITTSNILRQFKYQKELKEFKSQKTIKQLKSLDNAIKQGKFKQNSQQQKIKTLQIKIKNQEQFDFNLDQNNQQQLIQSFTQMIIEKSSRKNASYLKNQNNQIIGINRNKQQTFAIKRTDSIDIYQRQAQNKNIGWHKKSPGQFLQIQNRKTSQTQIQKKNKIHNQIQNKRIQNNVQKRPAQFLQNSVVRIDINDLKPQRDNQIMDSLFLLDNHQNQYNQYQQYSLTANKFKKQINNRDFNINNSRVFINNHQNQYDFINDTSTIKFNNQYDQENSVIDISVNQTFMDD